MIRCIRETGLIAPLAGGALMATVLVGISACGELSFSLGRQTDARSAVVEPAPVPVVQHGPAPQERMPPPFEAAEARPAPMPREKPALLLTVAYGDTLSEIAYRYGVAAVAIIELNGLTYPYWLQTGQRLRLPEKALAVARHDAPPAEAPRYVNGEPTLTVVAFEAEPAGPARGETQRSRPHGDCGARAANPVGACGARPTDGPGARGAHAPGPGGARGTRTAAISGPAFGASGAGSDAAKTHVVRAGPAAG